jgi:RimJ/RimL family protein N-acetyltransferase
MKIRAFRADFKDVEGMRDLYRTKAACQIVRDSALIRGRADSYLIEIDGKIGGYGGIWNEYYPNRIMEFFSLPETRTTASQMFRALITAGEATQIEAQTNIDELYSMLRKFTASFSESAFLFADRIKTNLPCPRGHFRSAATIDAKSIFVHQHEPVGDWLVEIDGIVAGTAGVYYHYNPPYGDVYMEVADQFRRQGFGSYLVQEMKRICYRSGKIPAARCNPDNAASRATLEKAGFAICGSLVVGDIIIA